MTASSDRADRGRFSDVAKGTSEKRAAPRSPVVLLNVASIATFALAWQIASYFAPRYAVPGWERIIGALSTVGVSDTLITTARIMVSMVVSFILGLALALLVFERAYVEAYVMPFVRLLMAVPAVCWVVFAILWFSGVEIRIFFVMCVVCAPVFCVDSLDAMKSVPR